MTEPLNQLSATRLAALVRAGDVLAEDVVRACMERIDEREETVGAWQFLDRDRALAQARSVDKSPWKGPLAGIPVGIKDIIDTANMPTGRGSPIYENHQPLDDAVCVRQLQQAGAIILGKTVTCEFAGLTPAGTANPLDPSRTPGGSSSGSAAAVADFMVPVALGTQTGGSVLRPSSYCGIIGFKPSYGQFSLDGVFPAAPSLDTLGIHARDIEDVKLVKSVLTPEFSLVDRVRRRRPMIGVCRTWMWSEAASESREAIDRAAQVLKGENVEITEMELPEVFRDLAGSRMVINDYERAVSLADEWKRHPDLVSPGLQATIRSGLEIDREEYSRARDRAADCRKRVPEIFGECDLLLTPVVDGEAPIGLDDTGSPRFQSLWTMLHLPTISLPTHTGPNGMPVGIQLVAQAGRDEQLLEVCDWIPEGCG